LIKAKQQPVIENKSKINKAFLLPFLLAKSPEKKLPIIAPNGMIAVHEEVKKVSLSQEEFCVSKLKL